MLRYISSKIYPLSAFMHCHLSQAMEAVRSPEGNISRVLRAKIISLIICFLCLMSFRNVVCSVQNIQTADWSEEVAPFWGAVIKSAVSADGIRGLFKAGWTTIKVCR